ncbi:hypothetical protein DRQ53_08480 [bacterium]|nr:MAG: hypothetical protein DRQ53_08480 [bacterium]
MDVRPQNHTHQSQPSWRASHWLHLTIAIAAMWLYMMGGLAQTHVSRLPDGFPLDQLHYPVTIGNYSASTEAELLARAEGTEVGQPIRVRDAESSIDEVIITVRAHTPFHDLVTRLNGLFFLAVSLIVFAPRVDIVPARDLFWACLLYGLAVMIGDVYAPVGPRWPWALLPLMRILSLVILPTLMLHVGLTFPRRASALDRNSWLMPVVTLLGLGLASWHFVAWFRWLTQDGSWADIVLPRWLGGVFLAVTFGWGCAGLVLGSRRSGSEREREQVKWVLWGIAMGGTPFVFFHALPSAVGSETVLPIAVARLFSIVIPLAFSLAVIRHKFLDVDIIIRRSLFYVLLASMMVGIYALIGIFVGRRVEEAWPASGPFVPIVATLIAALLFSPTRRSIGVLIDRVFFKIRYTHANALTAFRKDLRGATDQQQAADSLVEFLETHLGPKTIAATLTHGERRFVVGDWPDDQSATLALHGSATVVALPGTTAWQRIEADDFPRRLRERGFILAQAISAEGTQIGAVALAEKASARSYVAEDLNLLADAARETSIRVQRMNLEQDFVDEVVARHHTEEMGRFRSQFFAQFAHDLRSPLTSINWGARNLLDGVVGEVTPDQKSYLEGIETSARQLVRLVNNLLEVTRLESGMPEVEFESVDLASVVRDSVAKLRATGAMRNVELDVHANAPAWINGNEEKLLEVVDNLIENAIRYSPPGSSVQVTISGDADGIRLAVEDRGPGLDADDLDDLFEPYRQGTPSPHSSQHGFGLGLFVVKSWVKRMRGEVYAENRKGGGARFSVEFPATLSTTEQEM